MSELDETDVYDIVQGRMTRLKKHLDSMLSDGFASHDWTVAEDRRDVAIALREMADLIDALDKPAAPKVWFDEEAEMVGRALAAVDRRILGGRSS